MGRTLVAAVAAVVVALGCGTTPSAPSPCGEATCTADEVCIQSCHAYTCSFALPPNDTCPAGYVASEAQSSQPCCVVAPPPHCVVPAQATQKDCEYGQLMFRQNNDQNEPPVFCGCLV